MLEREVTIERFRLWERVACCWKCDEIENGKEGTCIWVVSWEGADRGSDPHAPHFGTIGGLKPFKESGVNLDRFNLIT